MNTVDTAAVSAKIDGYMREAAQLLSENHPGPAIVELRRSLEAVVNMYMQQYGVALDPEDNSLFQRITALCNSGIITNDEAAMFHGIRMDANKGGAHDDAVIPQAIAQGHYNDLYAYLTEKQIIKPVSGTSASSLPVEELKKLKELLDIGVITQAEFDAKKKKLLGI